ncbi:MAG: hypothetical protein ACR2GH_22940 [Pseudonocardia sp.]
MPAESAPGADPAKGHADRGEIVGQPIAEYVQWVVLAVTACADVAVFYQILSGFVLTHLPDWLVWLAVAGFTTCSLLLAHFAGRLFRDARVGYGTPEHGLIYVLAGTWLLLGLAAFTVRLVVAEGGAGATAATALGNQSQTVASAVLFLVLYVGSGMVSGIGAYLSRNPLRNRYRKAQRNQRYAQKRLHRSQAPYERAVSVLQLHIRNRQREADNYAAAQTLRVAYVEEMKAYTGILISGHLQDPSATTGVTSPRR